MKTNTISVIVAVYNTAKYLEKCITSIVSQSHQIDELIIVDDGSNDGSAEICNSYADKYEYIHVIHQKNKGQMAAQNSGLSIAQSEYVTFIDSDDWVEKQYIELFVQNMKYRDLDAIITSSICIEYENKQIIQPSALEDGFYNENDIKNKIIPRLVKDEIAAKPAMFAYLPGKVFRREKLIPILQRVNSAIKLGQDGAVTFPFIMRSNKIQIINNKGYHYVQRNESVSHKPSFNYYEELYLLKKHLADEAEKSNMSHLVADQFDIYVRDLLILTIRKIYGLEMGQILCVAPYEIINKGERIIIYGAGMVGKSFVKQFLHSGYASVCGWIDKHVTGIKYGIRIDSPEKIKDIEYDKILIAVTDNYIVNEIKNDLMNIGVPLEKIIYKDVYWG